MVASRNKMRLYLGYWWRQATLENPGKYHVGLFLTPKNPKNDKRTATIYHAVNRITDGGIWKFECIPASCRTPRRAGCMLLGKVPPKFGPKDIEEILRRVRVPSQEEAEEEKWRCRHWVCDALTLLVVEGVIPELPVSPHDLWDTGRIFVESRTSGIPNYGKPLYTCNTMGEEIPSEISALDTH
ncbi:hypothetical protein JR316_0006452 [Psilocybe cubensis]|uniref:Uncharacterized protein n=1 Tax=Psilocybe cubensis TaxID=181762 RepID=A0ACB8H2M8_PSICU|nr:hypothetical protein JR316_0006452 [Psilocybe cubensis]KAH9481922.1 hypothetical protein JR316_0006452 [Psilocybe cubensis]